MEFECYFSNFSSQPAIDVPSWLSILFLNIRGESLRQHPWEGQVLKEKHKELAKMSDHKGLLARRGIMSVIASIGQPPRRLVRDTFHAISATLTAAKSPFKMF